MINKNFISHRVFDNEQPRRGRQGILDWTRYWELQEMHSWLESLVEQYPNDTSLIDVGTSYERNRILGLKLNFGNGSGKKQLIFEGTIHAREWVS